MTDEEINRRVAEIEGFEWNGVYWFRQGEQPEYDGPLPYATDWGWCGPLAEKYGLQLRRLEHDDEENDETIVSWFALRGKAFGQMQPTPQRAICMAVIAAHASP